MKKIKKKSLTVPRQKKLKEEFPNGEAVGRAFVQFYLDSKRKERKPRFKPHLNDQEMDFLRSTVQVASDKKAFRPYYVLEQLLRQFEYWIERHENIFYRGLFENLSMIQASDYNIQIYYLLMNQKSPDKNSIEKAKVRCKKSLVKLYNILMPNWTNRIANSLKELNHYSFRLEKIQEIMNFDFSPIIPDMELHEREVIDVQESANTFRRNLGYYSNHFDSHIYDVYDNYINLLYDLDEFIENDAENLRLNDEEIEENIQNTLTTIKRIRRASDITKVIQNHSGQLIIESF